MAAEILVVSTLFPQIANQAGWVTAEMGRYPWIVQDLLRISDGLSKTVTANQILGSIILFTFLYIMLFCLFLYLLNEKFKHGPEGVDEPTHYPHLQKFVKEVNVTLFTDLQLIWFIAFVLLVTGYAILDGFDLGVGMLHLFSKKDEERRLMLNSIGPVWDGNEVWLVTAGGAVFAGFPDVYATFASAFYVPVMLLLTGIIFRAVAIEVRSKQPMAWWRWTWDVLFSFASFVIALSLGVMMGNLIRGIPLDEYREFTGTFWDLIDPYSLLIGLLAVSLFYMHGGIYVLMKTEGELHEKMRERADPSIITFIIIYVTATMATLIYMPHMTEAIKHRPLFFVFAVLNMLAIANIPREIHFGRDGGLL